MIVNYTEEGWQIITQRSHGLLAAQICVQWKIKKRPYRWAETITAISEHDDVYNEFENDDLLNEACGPVDFKQTSFRKDYCDRLIKMAEAKSAYIALLVSRHVQFVNGKDADARIYCLGLKEREKQWLKICGVSVAEVDSAYELVQFCDAFSLLLCQGLVQPEHRKIEISKGPGGITYQLYTLKSGLLTVKPWPFETERFPVTYESRMPKGLVFTDISRFREALAEAPVVQHEMILSKK